MPRVLLIDDQPDVRAALTLALNDNGFDVVSAENARAGLQQAMASRFDAAIIDIFMPDLNGLETTKAIHGASPSMPIIVMSGFMFGGDCPEMPSFEAMAVEAGAVCALYKPIKPRQLVDALQKAIAA